MKQWFVAHIQPCKEQLAERHLLEQGFNVYLPQFKKIRRHARRVEEVLSPLFPRYIFVELDLSLDQWRCVNGTRGVQYLIMNDGRPASVPNSIVNELKLRADENGVVPLEVISLFSKGDAIRIKHGALEGCLGTVERFDDNKRIQLLLEFLGRETRVSMPLEVVEAA